MAYKEGRGYNLIQLKMTNLFTIYIQSLFRVQVKQSVEILGNKTINTFGQVQLHGSFSYLIGLHSGKKWVIFPTKICYFFKVVIVGFESRFGQYFFTYSSLFFVVGEIH